MSDPTTQSVYAKTAKGVREIKEQKVRLPLELGLVFLSVDGQATTADLLPISGMTPEELEDALQALVEQGYIEVAKSTAAPQRESPKAPRAVEPPPVRPVTPKASTPEPVAHEEPPAPKRSFAGPVLDLTNLAQKLRAKVAAERIARQELEKSIQLGGAANEVAGADTGIYAPPELPRLESSQEDQAAHDDRIPLDDLLPDERSEGSAQRLDHQADAGRGPSRSDADDTIPMFEERDPDRAATDVYAQAAYARRSGTSDALWRQTRDSTHLQGDEEARSARRARGRMWRNRFLLGAGVIAGLLPVLAGTWLQLVPINDRIPDAQRIISGRLNQPVEIGALRYVLLPSPKFVLEGVRVGGASGIYAARVEAPVWPQHLFEARHVLEEVYAYGVKIEPQTLANLPAWTGGTNRTLHVKYLQLRDVTFNLAEAQVEPLSGTVTFTVQGAVQRAFVENEKVRFDVVPQASGVEYTLNARDVRIPFGPSVSFSHLSVAGNATQQQFTSTKVEGYLRGGGSLSATLNAKWSGPLVVSGNFNVQNARLQELMPAKAPEFAAKGLLKASGRYTLEASRSEGGRARPSVDASFSVTGGELGNVDLVRATQTSTGSVFGAGRTPFRELTGALQVAGSTYTYRQLQLVSGPLTASGHVEIGPERELKGRITAEFAPSGAVPTRSGLTVAGTLKEPQLVY
jgi:hypothetical protein